MTITWTPSTDSGSQLSHYAYEISTTTGMTDIILSGTLPNTVTTTQLTISSLPLGTYYLRMVAVDTVGLRGISDIITFSTSQSYCAA